MSIALGIAQQFQKLCPYLTVFVRFVFLKIKHTNLLLIIHRHPYNKTLQNPNYHKKNKHKYTHFFIIKHKHLYTCTHLILHLLN